MKYDVAVVGAGAVGSSVARRLAEDADVAVLEKELHLARHQSGRNSGVLHPGFNYEPGSTKACFAVEGTRRMKEFCRSNDVAVEECGVYVAAHDQDDEERLRELKQQADENGVEAEIVSGEEMREHEPHAAGEAALHAPEAASVDSVKYVHAVAGEAEDQGADYYMDHRVNAVSEGGSRRHRLESSKGAVEADHVVNCAGLHADRVAGEFDVGEGYRVVPFRGEYYELTPGRTDLCRSMIYPTPDPELPFLGVHFTRRTDGKVIVGPNAVLAFGREAYRNNSFSIRDLASIFGYPGFWRLMADRKMLAVAWSELNRSYRKKKFISAAQELVPDADAGDLQRSYSGVRAQLVSRDGDLVKQPLVETTEHSTHVLNAVSPGLTCSLPYGEHVAEQALDQL